MSGAAPSRGSRGVDGEVDVDAVDLDERDDAVVPSRFVDRDVGVLRVAVERREPGGRDVDSQPAAGRDDDGDRGQLDLGDDDLAHRQGPQATDAGAEPDAALVRTDEAERDD